MNYAELKLTDIANGPGVRVSLFVSGCPHHCAGCFNEATWDYEYGKPFTQEVIEKVIESMKPSYISGITLLGGEPMVRPNLNALLPLLKRVREEYPVKSIWCFTGYVYETDICQKMLIDWPETKTFLSYLDVLVDGPYIEEKRDITLRFRGSSNQNLIDIPKSLEAGKMVLWQDL